MITHPYDLEESRKTARELSAKAAALYPNDELAEWAEHLVLVLEKAAVSIPDCYKTPWEYMTDYCTRWPHDGETHAKLYRLIAGDDRFRPRMEAALTLYNKNHGTETVFL